MKEPTMPDRHVLPAIDKVLAELDTVKAEYRRHRWIMRVTLAVLAVAVLALAVTTGTYLRSARSDVRAADIAACEAANQVRAGLRDFVDTILAPPPTPLAPDATPDQRATFEARSLRRERYVERSEVTFGALDCA
jgi:hypothetical protein